MSSSRNNGFNNNFNNEGSSLAKHISEFQGETVTIFTTSGGVSGCGFTGVVLSVNHCFVRLVTEQGMAPTSPIAENICPDMDKGYGRGCGGGISELGGSGGKRPYPPQRLVGSVCDIPIDKIVAFCHNAV